MEIDQRDAALALASIDAAGARSAQLQFYRRFAPYLVLWGGVWLLANTVSDLRPALAGVAWLVFPVLGAAASIGLAVRQRASVTAKGMPRTRRDQGWRWFSCMLLIAGFQITAFTVLPEIDSRQQNTFASLLWTFLYMAVGVWAGWRLFLIGLAATLLILFGYYGIHSHYFLYMGWVSGGALIAGGLWLRRL